MKLSRLIAAIIIIAVLVISAFYVILQSNTTIIYKSEAEVSQYTTEYTTNAATTEPNGIAVDSNGNVWFTLWNKSTLAELTPATGVIHEFPIPTHMKGGTTTWGIVVDNSRGLVWFTEQSTYSIWSFGISNHKFTRYELQNNASFPYGITLDGQGNVWFTEFFNNEIGEITTSGKLTEIPVPLKGYLEISSITVDSSGKVWFTIPGIDFIGSYYEGHFQFKNLTGLAELPVGISVDNQGNIWMTEHGPSFLAEFNPTTNYFRTISTTVPKVFGTSLPYFDYVDQNGNIWFNEHEGNAMGEFFPSNSTLIEYEIPTEVRIVGNISGMLTSTLSPSGQPWYTEFFAGKVGTVNTGVPLDLHMNLLNYTEPIIMDPNQTTSIQVQISGAAASNATIEGSVGNFTSTFSFKQSIGQVGQIVTIHDGDSTAGVYFVTISAVTNSLAVSQVIEVEVL